jgi:ribosomal-protein-alanine N-acetyltransferase
MSFLLRGFRGSDLGEILEIEKVSFPDPWSKNGFLYHYRTSPDGFMVAEERGKVIGYAVAKIEIAFKVRSLRISRRCHLANLAVEPGHRGRGVGSRLLREVIRYAESRGAGEVYLEVRSRNRAARRFYEKRGFSEEKYKKGYYSNDDAVIMRQFI